MSFHEVLFPLDIARDSAGGPTRRTEIVALASGHEARNTPWAGSRRRYEAGYGVKSIADLEAVVAFFEARMGRLHGFRFRDPFDFSSSAYGAATSPSDQEIAIGDGATASFQLTKTYTSGGEACVRTIRKPVAGSVRVAVGGAELTDGADFAADPATGLIALSAPPAAGASVTAGFRFDTPVRFDMDELRVNLAGVRAGDIPSIPLIEILS